MPIQANDPVIFAEYAIDCAQAAHERGIKTVAVTAGYINQEPRTDFYAHMDAANVDLKAFTGEFYFCDARLPGRFDTKPGKWGRHRLPVFIRS